MVTHDANRQKLQSEEARQLYGYLGETMGLRTEPAAHGHIENTVKWLAGSVNPVSMIVNSADFTFYFRRPLMRLVSEAEVARAFPEGGWTSQGELEVRFSDRRTAERIVAFVHSLMPLVKE